MGSKTNFWRTATFITIFTIFISIVVLRSNSSVFIPNNGQAYLVPKSYGTDNTSTSEHQLANLTANPENLMLRETPTKGPPTKQERRLLKDVIQIPLLDKVSKGAFDVVPESFLPEFKNPCWFDKETAQSSTNGTEARKLLCLPYYYILGLAKCGSTDLWSRIREHPQVYKDAKKEAQWWARHINKQPLKKYVGRASNMADLLMKNSSLRGKLVYGDGSPSTLWENVVKKPFSNNFWGGPAFTTADILHAVQPNAKMLVTIREPVDRTYSDYMHFSSQRTPVAFNSNVVKATGQFLSCTKEGRSVRACAYDQRQFQAFTERIKIGFYAVYLRDWLRVFPREQIFITKLEDMHKNCTDILPRIFSFLELDALPSDRIEAICKISPKNVGNEKYKKTIPPMLTSTRKLLQQFFSESNRELGELLGPDFEYKYDN